jgi:AraC family transcriptional regulator of adaptative response / DNA-3-methyladenine glycosylase II
VSDPTTPYVAEVLLPTAPPLAGERPLAFLRDRALPGVEEAIGGAFRRALSLAHGPGTATLRLAEDSTGVRAHLRLVDGRDHGEAVRRIRSLLDLGTDAGRVDAALASDVLLGPFIRAVPRRQMPGSVDPWECAVRTVVGQHVSEASARAACAVIVARYGEALRALAAGGIQREFPRPAALVDAHELPVPTARATALRGLARAVAGEGLDLASADDAALLALPGIGPWTVAHLRLRGRGDPDAWLSTDLGVRRSLGRLGVQDTGPRALRLLGERWHPWRSYAVVHLWGHLLEANLRDAGEARATPVRACPPAAGNRCGHESAASPARRMGEGHLHP